MPAGTYTIEAWHEKLGTQTQTVTIGENDSKTVAFTFKSCHHAALTGRCERSTPAARAPARATDSSRWRSRA